MSWTPSFWIRKSDFMSIKKELKSFDGLDEISAWQFEIDGHVGVVFGEPETSSLARDLHAIIEHIPHWLLNSESESCDNCISWGDEIDLEFL